MKAFVDEKGSIDLIALGEAQKLSTRAGMRMTLVDLELPEWDKIHKRDRLAGCSLTGTQDAFAKYSEEEERQVLSFMRDVANKTARDYAYDLRIPIPLLVTTVKPEGCWTSEFTRVTDDGILFIDEIEPDIDDNEGFIYKTTYPSVNENTITATYKNEIKDILKITLKNGRILRVTPQHPLSVKSQWVSAENLKIGQVLDYELGNYTNTKEAGLRSVDSAMVNYRTDIRDYNTPREMSCALAYLLGAYFANGSFTTNDRIKFHCQYFEIHKRVQEIWFELFGVETRIIRSTDRNSFTQDFRSTKIRLWLEANNIRKYNENGDMIIPKVVRTSSYESILSFITGYADNDGCFANKTFSIDTSKEEFARHLQEVAEAVGLSFGISINKARDNSFSQKPMYKLHLSRSFSSKSAIDFINSLSIKVRLKGEICPGVIRSANPYTIAIVEGEEQQQTYDIEVANQHWYYQGALKSHNTLSLVAGGVSPGIHDAHSPYFIRRIRISVNDALAQAAITHGWRIHPEVGTLDNKIENARILVIDFPIKSDATRTKNDVGALEQLKRYFTFQKFYTDHNSSNTITVRPDEWLPLEDEIYDSWDDFVGVSFLALDGGTYQLAPYEEITKEEFDKLSQHSMPFDPDILQLYEVSGESELDAGDPDCATGGCPTR